MTETSRQLLHEIEIRMMEESPVVGFYCTNDASIWGRALDLIADPNVSDAIAIRAIRVIDRITGETSDIEAEGGLEALRAEVRRYQP